MPLSVLNDLAEAMKALDGKKKVRQPFSGMPALLCPACVAIESNLNAPGLMTFNSKENDLTS